MDRKQDENQGSTSDLLCGSTELPTKTILGDRDEDMLFFSYGFTDWHPVN
jgi:hypothetical protein